MILQKLIEDYTSGESSSVTYETAQMLLEAIRYCMEEYYQEKAETEGTQPEKEVQENGRYEKLPMPKGELPAEQIYREGREAVLRKVYRTKDIYERIIADFDDYGCMHYRDTILKGMPAFFVRYEPRFCPQDHILTLDYPVSEHLETLCGVDRIYRYLLCVEREQAALSQFPREAVIECLQEICLEYESLFLDNIWETFCRYRNLNEKDFA